MIRGLRLAVDVARYAVSDALDELFAVAVEGPVVQRLRAELLDALSALAVEEHEHANTRAELAAVRAELDAAQPALLSIVEQCSECERPAVWSSEIVGAWACDEHVNDLDRELFVEVPGAVAVRRALARAGMAS